MTQTFSTRSAQDDRFTGCDGAAMCRVFDGTLRNRRDWRLLALLRDRIIHIRHKPPFSVLLVEGRAPGLHDLAAVRDRHLVFHPDPRPDPVAPARHEPNQ